MTEFRIYFFNEAGEADYVDSICSDSSEAEDNFLYEFDFDIVDIEGE